MSSTINLARHLLLLGAVETKSGQSSMHVQKHTQRVRTL